MMWAKDWGCRAILASPCMGDTIPFRVAPSAERKAESNILLVCEQFAESEKRVGRLPKYIEQKLWSEVEGELDRQMYDTRASMLKVRTNTQLILAQRKSECSEDEEGVSSVSCEKEMRRRVAGEEHDASSWLSVV